jgi:PHD/YefM family antitoxin component YafN of YafNO toxin-antitoxin module
MLSVNINSDNCNLAEIIDRVTELGERIIVEQPGKTKVAIIAYDDLKRLEALEEILREKAELEEYGWLKAAANNPAFDFLNDPEEDIYTLADGKPFHDNER